MYHRCCLCCGSVFADCTSGKCITNVASVAALCLRASCCKSALQDSETSLHIDKHLVKSVNLQSTMHEDMTGVLISKIVSFVARQEECGVSSHAMCPHSMQSVTHLFMQQMPSPMTVNEWFHEALQLEPSTRQTGENIKGKVRASHKSQPA